MENSETKKSTVEEIRQRFDGEVERFSSLETGQAATMDAPLVLDLITTAAAAVTPGAVHLVDVGCGAGNYSLKMLQRLPGLKQITLIDLSRPMLERARERISAASGAGVTMVQQDIRLADLPESGADIIVAAAVLHHLRTDEQWVAVFQKFYRALRPGGSLWISDLVEHAIPQVHRAMWNRYGEYLAGLKGEAYREAVFAYVEKEDTPRSLVYQLELLKSVGFAKVEVLHKNSVFATFGAARGQWIIDS